MHYAKSGYPNPMGADRQRLRPPGITASIVIYKTDPNQLARALLSLSGSDLLGQLMVIDNSPDDQLRRLVEDFGAEYVRPGRNLGFGAGHNLAMIKYRDIARYHVVVNPDITCGVSVLRELYQFMESYPDVGLVMPKVQYPDGSEQRLCKLLPAPLDLILRRFVERHTGVFADRLDRYELRDLDLRISREIPCLSGCFMFIRSSALEAVGFFDERFFMYMEDVDLCRRIGARFKTVFYPAVSVTHDYAKGSYRNSKLLRYHVLSAIRYFEKWGWIRDPQRDEINRRTSPLAQSPKVVDAPGPMIEEAVLRKKATHQ